ncbi:FAD-dependent oxidoreductase [Dyella silvatica]|uniref:FAD-dependent oxidoreductase n=1 Tax=Dyella silvatica TaxID=2992128 RepID=UPI00225903C5|nr:FAD-dependent monooxygenase [Dyella silvatica]
MAKRVAVVGGGIAGPVLAIFLRQAGFEVTVYEALAMPSEQGGGIGLGCNGMRVLRAAGLEDAVRAASVRQHGWSMQSQRGRRLVEVCVDEQARYGITSVLMARTALQAICSQGMQFAGASIRYAKRVTAIEDQEGQPVVLRFEDGSHAEADMVVAADGIRSSVRQLIMPDAPGPVYTGLIAPGGFSPCVSKEAFAAGAGKSIQMTLGQRGFFGMADVLTPAGPRTMWWSTAEGPLPDREADRRLTLQDRKAALLRIHGDWPQPIAQLIESTEEILPFAIHDVPSLPSWSKGRVLLIGDAAHAVAPHSGQGASMALEDAQMLAKLLRENSDDVPAVFARFERERRPRTDRVIALGRQRGAQKHSRSLLAYWARISMMRLLLPIFARRPEDWLFDYRVE